MWRRLPLSPPLVTKFSTQSSSFLRVPVAARSAAARLLRSWVRIPPRAWMFVCCECCVLSGRGLCDGLITRPEQSCRLWRVVVRDQETSGKKMRRLKSATGLWKIQPQWVVTPGKQTNNLSSTCFEQVIGHHQEAFCVSSLQYFTVHLKLLVQNSSWWWRIICSKHVDDKVSEINY